MRIRRATPTDFVQLKELKAEFYAWECSVDPRLDPGWATRGLPQRLARNLRQKDTAFFVAEEKGVLLGYAGAEIKRSEAAYRNRWHGHLFNLYVRRSAQRRGVGTALISACLAWFAEHSIDDLMLYVYAGNDPARRLYERHGFREYVRTMISKTE